MDWSSGFFESPSAALSEPSSLELIHESKDGYSLLFRCSSGGRFRLYKALKPEFRDQPVYRDLLRKEFSIGVQLDHPNIRRYLDFRPIEGLGEAIEMEWIDGTPLDECDIHDRKSAVRIIDGLCDALEYVHRKQIIHRDIKPSNILVTHNGLNVKLIDFGFSDADWCSLLKTPAGTLKYASPELKTGGDVDCRTDVYSLGAVIKEILPRNHGVAGKCLRDDRNSRFTSAESVKSALHRRRALSVAAAVSIPLVLIVIAAALILPAGNTVGSGSGNMPAPAAITPADTPAIAPADTPAITPADTGSVDIEDVFNEATKMIMDAVN